MVGSWADPLARHAFVPDAKPSRLGAFSRMEGDEPRNHPKFSELVRFSPDLELTWGSLVNLVFSFRFSCASCIVVVVVGPRRCFGVSSLFSPLCKLRTSFFNSVVARSESNVVLI